MAQQHSQLSVIFSVTLSVVGAFSLAAPRSVIEIKGTSLQAPSALEPLSVIHHNQDGFSVLRDGKTSKVQTHSLDKSLRSISQHDLKDLLNNNGYLRVTQAGDGGYLLHTDGRLQGGGPTAGLIAYWTVKGGGYALVGLGSLAVGAIVGKGSQIKNPGPAGIQTSLKEASVATSATIGVASAAGVFTGIEAAATAVGAFFGFTPTP